VSRWTIHQHDVTQPWPLEDRLVKMLIDAHRNCGGFNGGCEGTMIRYIPEEMRPEDKPDEQFAPCMWLGHAAIDLIVEIYGHVAMCICEAEYTDEDGTNYPEVRDARCMKSARDTE